MVAIGIKLSIVAIKNQPSVDLETLWDAQADLSVSYVVILNCFVYCQTKCVLYKAVTYHCISVLVLFPIQTKSG